MCSITEFPAWNPSRTTRIAIENGLLYTSMNPYLKGSYERAIRNSSGSFISKQQVRNYIFKRDGYCCKICGDVENLEIDHIISVNDCIHGKINVYQLNTEENLQTLCKSCNSSKKHLR